MINFYELAAGLNDYDKYGDSLSIILDRDRCATWVERKDAYLVTMHIIKKSPKYAAKYAEDMIEGRWLEVEDVIMKNPLWAAYYAVRVIRRRWPEAEPYIKESEYCWAEYSRRFKI